MATIELSTAALLADDRAILWSEIESIHAYKVDAYVVDQIRFFINAKSGPLEIGEEDEGFTVLMEKLPEYLPGCESMGEWYMHVAFPAFERCERVIYATKGHAGG
jgi:hypothetical protein